MNEILINGVAYKDNSAELKKVAVKINGSWHSRGSDDIVKIGGRFFRKNSPLVAITLDGQYAMLEDTIEVFSNGRLYRFLKGDSRVIHTKLDTDSEPKYYLSSDIIGIGGAYYLKSDDRVVKSRSGLLCLKENCVKLHNDYGKDCYLEKKYLIDGYCVEFKGGIYLSRDILNIASLENGKLSYSTKAVVSDDDKKCFQKIGFITNEKVSQAAISRNQIYRNNSIVVEIDAKNCKSVYIHTSEVKNRFLEELSRIDGVVQSSSEITITIDDYNYIVGVVFRINGNTKEGLGVGGGFLFLNDKFSKESLIEEIKTLITSTSEKVTKKLGQKFSEINSIFNFEKEKIPKAICQNISTEGAAYHLSRVEFLNHISDKEKNDKTGGINYSFGVEIETSYGVVPTTICRDLNLGKVGDRTIGAMEYITPPLHGNKGIEYLRLVADHLSNNTMVDDRCGLHVHVGGIKGSNFVSHPNFGYDFAYRAILLGSFIEDEMYNMLPSVRSYTSQCQSMKKFGENITNDNKLDIIGTYIYGAPISKVDTNAPVSKWTDLRKKWLNLMYCTANYRQQTLEFRIFPSTTDAYSIVCNVLLTMAFVKLVDTDVNLEHIKKGITLNKMLDLTLNPDCSNMVKRYVMYNKKLKRSKTKDTKESSPISSVNTLQEQISNTPEPPVIRPVRARGARPLRTSETIEAVRRRVEAELSTDTIRSIINGSLPTDGVDRLWQELTWANETTEFLHNRPMEPQDTIRDVSNDPDPNNIPVQ